MKTVKLTSLERRALAFCDRITRNPESPSTLTIEWRDNREGTQAIALNYSGDVMARTGGGGYCKESTALADALRYLGADETARHRIARTGGAGVSSVQRALLESGWILENTASGKRFDVYSITRATPAA
jgi:hypothetical protein